MKYILMAGGKVQEFGDTPRQMSIVRGKPLIQHTVDTLHELGIEKVYISTNIPEKFNEVKDAELIVMDNSYVVGLNEQRRQVYSGYWVDAFYETDEPCCYLMGDCYYCKEALQQIINEPVTDVLFFGTKAPFPAGYHKKWEEPLAFKVQDQKFFRHNINRIKKFQDEDQMRTHRLPISWELYRFIEGWDINKHSFGPRFRRVPYFTGDIDSVNHIPGLEKNIQEWEDSRK